MKKTYLKSLLAALLLLCSTIATAHDFEVDGIFYNILSSTDKTVAVTYKGNYYNEYSYEYSGAVTIPASVTYNGTTYSVTTIGSNAFRSCINLESITIPNSVTSIGENAFDYCISIKEVYITDLAAWCNIDFGNEYSSPLYAANTSKLYLNGEAITNIVIPDGVTELMPYAFSGCTELTSITIPSSVTTIGEGAFKGCTNLEEVYITNLVAWCNIDFGNEFSCPFSSSNYNNKTTKLYLNGEVITDIVIPEEVTELKPYIFRANNTLTGVTIHNSVTSIGHDAFSSCYSLKSVTIPNSVTTLGVGAFWKCSDLESVTIPNSVTTIGNGAFEFCQSLESVTIGSGVTSIGEYAFSGCNNLESIKTESGNTKYDSRENCNAIIETETNTLIAGCKNTIIPSSVTSIGNWAFQDCSSLTSVTIPNSVTTIGYCAFSGCYSLTSVTIPNSVTTIGYDAFAGCYSLTSVTIPNSVKTIEAQTFVSCSNLTNVTIPNSVTTIEDWAFCNCSSLKSVTIPNSVTTIGVRAFCDCSSLTSITIPNSVTTIESYAFYGCYYLKTVHNLSSLNIVAGSEDHGYVAYYADNIITIPGCTAEEDFIFDENGILVAYAGNDSEVVLLANYKGGSYSIGNNAFRGNTTMESVTIPASVTSIGECAFTGCSNLTSIYAESSLPSWLASDAFAEHYNSATLYVPAGTKAAYTATTPQREDYEVTVPRTNFNDLQNGIKSCNADASYTTVNIATQNPDVTGILYGSDYLLAYTIEKNASKMPSATFSITGTNSGRYKIALVTAPWFIESYKDTLVTSTDAPKYRKSYLRVSVSQNNELKGIFPSDSVKLRSGGYGVLATSAIVPDSARIDTIFLKDTNGEDFIFDLNYSGFIYDTDLSNSIDVKVELLAPAYKRNNAYMAMNNNHYAHRFLLDQIMLVPVDDKKIVSTVYWSNFANIVEMEPTTLPGDITGDGEVNVADVTSIVAMILDASLMNNVADITGDGEVNVADVTSLVSIILGTSDSAPACAAATRSADAPVVSASFDEENNMYINVSNPDYPFTAIQFDLTIDGGISVVTDGEYYDVFLGSRTSSRNHSQPECAVQPDGSLRVVILSLKNKVFNGTEGDVATVSLDLTGVADGSYSYSIKNIVLSDPQSVMEYPADVEGWTTVTDGVTGINSIAADSDNANEAIYDLSGRKVANPVKGGIYIKGGKKIIM